MTATSVAGSVEPRGLRVRWALLVVLLLAAVLRLSWLDQVPLTNQMAANGLTANVLVAAAPETGWPLAGTLSEGIRGSSLFVYLIWLPNQIVWHPLTGVLLVAVLNIIAVGLVYHVAGTWYGRSAALSAGLLYACSPWAIIFSRQLWSGCCLAVFSLWLIAVSLTWLERGGAGRLVLMLVLGLLIPQVHFGGLAATAWLLMVLIVGRERLRASSLTAGLCFGLAAWTPWVAFHHMGGWDEFTSSLSVLSGKAPFGTAIVEGIDLVQAMLHSGRFDYWFSATPADLPDYFPAWQRGLMFVTAVLMVLGLAAAVARAFSGSPDETRHRVSKLLLLWLVLPLLGGLIYRPAFRPEQLVVFLPVALVIIGGEVGHWLDRLSRQPGWALRAGLSIVVFSHILVVGSWNSFLEDDQARSTGEYGLSYRQRRDVARWILGDCDGQSVELAGPFRGGFPAYEYIYYFERSRRGFDRMAPNPNLKYWVDEIPEDERLSVAARNSVKEREIGATLNRFQTTSSRWRIEKTHTLGPSRIYRIRKLENTPLKTASTPDPDRPLKRLDREENDART